MIYSSKIDYLRANKDSVIESYAKLKNVWLVGELFNVGGGTIHELLSELGLINKMNRFSKEDEKFLIENYKSYRDVGNLSELALILNRTKPFICRKAKSLGLTDKENSISMKPFAELLSAHMTNYIKENGHPKGMLNKKHSEESKKKFSENALKNWSDPNSFLNSQEHRQNLSDRMSKYQASGKLNNNYSRTMSGTVDVFGRLIFFRSSWECNVAFYFEFLKKQNLIKEWEYEPTVFWFEKIKRGVRSYKPDFRITNNDDTFYYVEVKGWMDSKSKTKLNRMRIYYPEIKIDLIDAKRYKEITKSASLVEGWGSLENGIVQEFKKCSIEGCENKSHSKDVCRKHYFKLYKK